MLCFLRVAMSTKYAVAVDADLRVPRIRQLAKYGVKHRSKAAVPRRLAGGIPYLGAGKCQRTAWAAAVTRWRAPSIARRMRSGVIGKSLN